MAIQSSFNKIVGSATGAVVAHRAQQQKAQQYQAKQKKAEEAMKARKKMLREQKKKKNELYISVGGQRIDPSKLSKEATARIKKQIKENKK